MKQKMTATGLGPLLEARGIKRAWLARRAGVSAGHLTHVINGSRRTTSDVAERVSDLLQVPLFLLFEFSDEAINASPIDELNGEKAA